MYKKRNVLIWGQNQESEHAVLLLKEYFENAKKPFRYTASCAYEEVYEQIVDSDPTLVIVLADGGNGLECVFQSKKYDRNMTVFWFSDDPNFSPQSHRLECAYFTQKPLTAEKLNKAFSRCSYLGISV